MDGFEGFEILCPKCGSKESRCVNEYTQDYTDVEGEIFSIPVGEMVCQRCGHFWLDDKNVDDGLTPYRQPRHTLIDDTEY